MPRDDLSVLENFVYGDTPDLNAVRGLIEDIFSRGSEFDVSLYDLSFEHDIRPLVLRTLLTYLELEGFLAGGTPLYGQYRIWAIPIQTLADFKGDTGRFEGSHRAFLADLFRQARKARFWFHSDPAATAMVLGTNRERIIHILDWLGGSPLPAAPGSGGPHRTGGHATPLRSETEGG